MKTLNTNSSGFAHDPSRGLFLEKKQTVYKYNNNYNTRIKIRYARVGVSIRRMCTSVCIRI